MGKVPEGLISTFFEENKEKLRFLANNFKRLVENWDTDSFLEDFGVSEDDIFVELYPHKIQLWIGSTALVYKEETYCVGAKEEKDGDPV